MKDNKKHFFKIILFIFIFLTINSINAEAATVKLNKTKVTIYVGQTTTLKIKGTKSKVKWSSSNKKVATVNSKGKVNAKKKGTAKITAKVGKKKLTCKVIVKNPYLNERNVSLEKGNAITLKLIGSKAKTWSSSYKTVATVNKSGKVTAVGVGTTTIKVKAANKKTYTCKITVTETTKTPSHTHNYVETVTKVATCKEEGMMTYKCSCGISYTESIAKVSHNYANVVNTKAVTCIEDGENSAICTMCGYTERTTIKSSGHSMVNGVCTVCGYIEESHTHNYESSITKQPTCQEIGIKTYTCVCGNSYTENIDKTNHNLVNGSCTVCGFSENHIHKYEQSEIQNATCISTGKRTYICSCGDFYTDEIELQTHIYETLVVVPKCEEKGYTLYTCIYCGNNYKSDYVNEKGHSWNDGTKIITASCSEKGLIQYQCNDCNKFKNVTLPKLEHVIPEDWVIVEFCGDVGCKYQQCTKCGTHINEEILPPTGKHVFLSDGYCKECDYYSEENHQHNYTITVSKEVSCSQDGEKLYSCICGASYTETVSKLEHTETDWIIDTNATCEGIGSKHKECSVCNEITITEDIEPLGHKYELINTIPSTCTTNGYKEYVCTNCGGSYKETLALKEHSYGHFVEKVAPKDFETFGTADMVCTACNTVLYADLTAVLIDMGNGNSTTVYGYYDYDEAYKNYELTYQYKLDNGILEMTDKFEWDEEMYILSCVRVAEMAYMDNLYGQEISLHTRPNGEDDISHAENAASNIGENAQMAMNMWLDSVGHRLTIELSYPNRMSVSMLRAWVPNEKNSDSWKTFWVQNYRLVH